LLRDGQTQSLNITLEDNSEEWGLTCADFC
jgi:hypothetical protein